MEFLIGMLVLLSLISGLFTQCCKVYYKQEGKEYNANLVAFANAVLVGGAGSAIYMVAVSAFTWYLIPVAIVLVWMGSMIGYDKVIQTLKLAGGNKK